MLLSVILRIAVAYFQSRGYVIVPQARIDQLTAKVQALDARVKGFKQ